MAQRSHRLWDPIRLSAAAATYYTAVNVRVKNLWITATNPTTTAYLVSIYIVIAASAASDALNVITFQRTILPGASVVFYEMCGHVLEPGDFVSAKCDSADKVVFMGSGDEASK